MQKTLAVCCLVVVGVLISGALWKASGQAFSPEGQEPKLGIQREDQEQASTTEAAAPRQPKQRTSEHVSDTAAHVPDPGSGNSAYDDSQQAVRTELASRLRGLSLRMTSEVPPSLREVELLLTDLAQAMHVDPATIERGDDGKVVGAVMTLAGTQIEASLALSGASASVRFSLPPAGESGLYVAGALSLNLELAGRHATRGGATFQHYANTNKASSDCLKEGETAICGWTYAEGEGGTSITPIEMAAGDDGTGWAIGNLGETAALHTPGDFNLTPYDSWAHLIATEALED